MDPYTNQPSYPSWPRRSSNAILWLLGGAAVIGLVGCGGLLAIIGYLGTYGPDTSVYTGLRIPARFVSTMQSVGALEDEEEIVYFYSDALTDIRDGFYFVSDRKVAVYVEDGAEPLTAIPFASIEDLELFRNESFFEDSEITLYLGGGEVISFPVSSEFDRDEKFFEAIRTRTSTAERVP